MWRRTWLSLGLILPLACGKAGPSAPEVTQGEAVSSTSDSPGADQAGNPGDASEAVANGTEPAASAEDEHVADAADANGSDAASPEQLQQDLAAMEAEHQEQLALEELVARLPANPARGEDHLECGEKWRVENWGHQAKLNCLSTSTAPDANRVLAVRYHPGDKEKTALMHPANLPQRAAAVSFDAFNPQDVAVSLAVAVITAPGQEYWESDLVELPPHRWARLRVSLDDPIWKSHATNWNCNAPVRGENVRRLGLLIYNESEAGQIVFDTLQLVPPPAVQVDGGRAKPDQADDVANVPERAPEADGVEARKGWSVREWGNPGEAHLLRMRARQEGRKVLGVLFNGGTRDKVAVGLPLDHGVPADAEVTFAAYNYNAFPIDVALALVTGDDWVYHESTPVTLQPGVWQDVSFKLSEPSWKTKASKWELKVPVSGSEKAREIMLLVYNSDKQTGRLVIEALRVPELPEAADDDAPEVRVEEENDAEEEPELETEGDDGDAQGEPEDAAQDRDPTADEDGVAGPEALRDGEGEERTPPTDEADAVEEASPERDEGEGASPEAAEQMQRPEGDNAAEGEEGE